jgi:hypothetical protein
MNDINPKNKPTFSLLEIIKNPRFLLKVFGRILLLEMVTFALGLGIWLIVHGIWVTAFRLSVHWEPAFKVTTLIMGIKPENKPFSAASFSFWFLPVIILHVIIGFCLFASGILIILKLGLCEQNLICLLLRY